MERDQRIKGRKLRRRRRRRITSLESELWRMKWWKGKRTCRRNDRGKEGMAMGQGRDGFYIPRPHTQLSCTYPLPYPYPTGMKN